MKYEYITSEEALALSDREDLSTLMAIAADLRDSGFGNCVTYSRIIFITQTQLCREVCHYCTFAKAPKKLGNAYLPLERVVEIAIEGKARGCKEALFTLC